MGLVFFFFSFLYKRISIAFVCFFFLLETEQGSRQVQAATWVLAPVPGGPSGIWGGWDVGQVPTKAAGAERGKAQHREGTAAGDPRGGGGEHPVAPTAGAGWHMGDKVTDTGHPRARGGLRVTGTPSDPSRTSGKAGSFQDPPAPPVAPFLPSFQIQRVPTPGELALGSPPAPLNCRGTKNPPRHTLGPVFG